MKTILAVLLCVVLVSLCWPLALVLLLLWPVLWLLSIPFRMLATVVDAALALFRAVLFLPARLLGYRPPVNP